MNDLPPTPIDVRLEHRRPVGFPGDAASAPAHPSGPGAECEARRLHPSSHRPPPPGPLAPPPERADAIVTPIHRARRRGFGERIDAVRAAVRALDDDGGAATAEYAIVVLAAVGFGGLLVVILRSGDVKAMLTDLIHRALTGG